ncbi:MAG: glucose dehydrogenase [Robiginitomaculum sp.]|nr:MAG: glucose dehydrogenase [Robiginitomaculum sp.]
MKMSVLNRVFALALTASLVACGAPEAKDTKQVNDGPFAIIHHEASQQASFDVVQITDQLSDPWAMVFLPDGDFLITEKTGQVVRVSSDTGQITAITGGPEVLVSGQGGLLDLALSPDFATDGRIFLSFAEGTNAQNHTAIASAVLHGDELTDLKTLFQANTTEKKKGAHFGSRFVLDGKGYLFASIGEGFNWSHEAQNPHSHFGKIIRLHLDGSVPDDNPFADGVDGAPEIWSYGHRNPQGLTLHPVTGKIWESEHGPKGGDEINILQKGGNYGWPKATFGMGYTGKSISEFSSLPGMVDSILHWVPSIAPSGLDFYEGDKFPNWNGDLFSGALAGKQLRRIELDGETEAAQERLLVSMKERIRDVRSGPDGFLYLLTDSGKLLRLEPS